VVLIVAVMSLHLVPRDLQSSGTVSREPAEAARQTGGDRTGIEVASGNQTVGPGAGKIPESGTENSGNTTEEEDEGVTPPWIKGMFSYTRPIIV